jgi:hypothetical protein
MITRQLERVLRRSGVHSFGVLCQALCASTDLPCQRLPLRLRRSSSRSSRRRTSRRPRRNRDCGREFPRRKQHRIFWDDAIAAFPRHGPGTCPPAGQFRGRGTSRKSGLCGCRGCRGRSPVPGSLALDRARRLSRTFHARARTGTKQSSAAGGDRAPPRLGSIPRGHRACYYAARERCRELGARVIVGRAD